MFVKRYCVEATQMLDKMKGSCPELEGKIQEIIDEHFPKTV